MRTRVMPRWLAVVSYAVAAFLLFVVSYSTWVVLAFPAWVLLVSGYILIQALRRPATP
jgi:phosphatidylserine synthase